MSLELGAMNRPRLGAHADVPCIQSVCASGVGREYEPQCGGLSRSFSGKTQKEKNFDQMAKCTPRGGICMSILCRGRGLLIRRTIDARIDVMARVRTDISEELD
jgi:hypothetical protein